MTKEEYSRRRVILDRRLDKLCRASVLLGEVIIGVKTELSSLVYDLGIRDIDREPPFPTYTFDGGAWYATEEQAIEAKLKAMEWQENG